MCNTILKNDWNNCQLSWNTFCFLALTMLQSHNLTHLIRNWNYNCSIHKQLLCIICCKFVKKKISFSSIKPYKMSSLYLSSKKCIIKNSGMLRKNNIVLGEILSASTETIDYSFSKFMFIISFINIIASSKQKPCTKEFKHSWLTINS